MKILIEFYDMDEPLLNLISALVLRPDIVVFMGNEKIRKQKYQRPLQKALNIAGIHAELKFVPVRMQDYQMVFECMESVLDQYVQDHCIIDVVGGNDLLLLAAGQCCADRDIDIINHRIGENSLIWLRGKNAGNKMSYDIHMDVSQAITLAGGELLRHGHVNPKDLDAGLLNTILNVFNVYNRNRHKWPYFVKYLQQLGNPDYWVTDETDIRAPKRIFCGGQALYVDLGILSELAEAGAIEDIRVNSTECAFRFTSGTLEAYLKDVGIWLELYLYAMMLKSKQFDSVEINAVVSWDDDDEKTDTINEIDLIATKDTGKIFISCKTAIPDNAALNEIATLTRRFGGKYARAALATMCDLKTEAPAVFRRAIEMGISVIDADDLFGDALMNRLESICPSWN